MSEDDKALTPKLRAKLPQQNMAHQDPHARVENNAEVALGYSAQQAIAEAQRCPDCQAAPCIARCPANINIPGFITRIQQQDFEGALNIILESNVLPAVCGRVCPQERQCQSVCMYARKYDSPTRSVGIGRLERFVADWARENKIRPRVSVLAPSGKKVAVVGSGPAGLSCAADAAKLGHQAAIFEALHEPGGVLTYGIPEFRLPKDIVRFEIEQLKSLGIEINTNIVVGNLMSVTELLESGYDAVFIGTGAGLPFFLNVPGENHVGVYSANEYLTRYNLMRAYSAESNTPLARHDDVLVFGAGNVAMDAARTARRSGAKRVSIIYRRTQDQMPARWEEIDHAKEEGVIFHELTAPVEIIGDVSGRVTSVRCQRMQLGEPDVSGRARPVAIEGSEFELPAKVVIIAIGNGPNPLISRSTPDLKLNTRGNIVVDPETAQTNIPGVFAGGDIVLGAATVILAIAEGRKAAKGIHRYLSQV